MKITNDQRLPSRLKLAFLLVLIFVMVDGCSKDSSPTGPSSPILTLAGRWSGSGSYFDLGMARRLDISWIADFGATKEDSSFTGNWTSTCTTPGIYYTGDQLICGVKGKFTQSRQATIGDTSMVGVHQGIPSNIMDKRYWRTFVGCVVSVNGDTLSYSGPSPEFETLVLVKNQ